MKNVMTSLMLFLIVATGINAKTIIDSDKEKPRPDQTNNNNISYVTDTLSSYGPIGIIDNKSPVLDLKLYPNPATTNLTVSFDCSSFTYPEPVFMYVIDMKGRVLMSMTENADNFGTFNKDINIRGLPDDEYIFQLIKGNRKLVKKFQVYY